jgi:hypothetical protein
MLTQAINCITVAEYLETICKARKGNKGKWLAFVGNVDGVEIAHKFYDNYNQILELNGINHASGTTDTKRDWISQIETAFNYTK